MKTLIALMGSTLAGSLGWWLGEYVGLMTAFMLGLIGSIVGWYASRRLINNFLE